MGSRELLDPSEMDRLYGALALLKFLLPVSPPMLYTDVEEVDEDVLRPRRPSRSVEAPDNPD